MSSVDNSRGSVWHKWDLHVHTPASLVHNYPGNEDEQWESFVEDIESLPKDFKVLGVNDYLFLEGYERVLELRDKGRLSNIELVLPVIELRLNVFGGSESKLSKVNYHVLFSEEISPAVIRNQFISGLTSSFQLAPMYAEDSDVSGHWTGVITKEALADLGEAIIESVPDTERNRYSTPMMEGFGNLTVSLADIQDRLATPFFKDKVLTGVGKTEWGDVKWTDGSIADKKNVINSADLVFVASESTSAYRNARDSLVAGGVNHHLIDCSDAHHLSSSTEKDRIGNCSTWIKSDLTYEGLRHAVEEFDHRVFIGGEPAQITRTRESPSRYIRSIEVRKTEGSDLRETWFDFLLPLNSGLVAVIGNKGSGKSALMEMIALLGRSDLTEQFSFLNSRKFCEPGAARAQHFQGSLTWMDGRVTESTLSDAVPAGSQPQVRHLPQQYLEGLCNEVPRGGKTEFDEQLERIIFSHIPDEQKLKTNSLGDLVRDLSRSGSLAKQGLRKELSEINARVVEIEEALREDAKRKTREEYQSRRREWYGLKSSPPRAVRKPDDSDPEREAVRARIRELEKARACLGDLDTTTRAELTETRKQQADLGALRAGLERLGNEHKQLMAAHKDLLVSLKIEESTISFNVDYDVLDAASETLAERITHHERLIDGQLDRSLPAASAWIDDETLALRSSLNEAGELYEEYLEQKRDWEARVNSLVGKADEPGSLISLRQAVEHLKVLPEEMDSLRSKRQELVKEIHEELLEEARLYAELYKPLEKYMDQQNISEDYRLSIESGLVDTGFEDRFLNDGMINRQVNGSFCGVAEGRSVLESLLRSTDFNSTESVIEFAANIDHRIHHDHRYDERPTEVESQLRKGRTVQELYDLIYSLDYLSPRYGLQFGGKPVYLLSPGEKGVLLLIFFLIAEQENIPLLIDQPEDNLDNQTVYKALYQCFHAAKERRQVIVVTHNPNLAVVCDADQIILSSMEKDAGNRVKYQAGPIEDPEINKAIVDVLEGTRPAFRNRRIKYELHERGSL